MTTDDRPRPGVAPHGVELAVDPPRPLPRILASVAGASVSGLAVAAVDAHLAFHAATGKAPERLPLLALDVAVMAPLALFVGIGVGVLSLALLPWTPSLAALAARLDAGDDRERTERALRIAALGLLGSLGLVVASQAARSALGAPLPPRLAGGVLAVQVVMIALGVAVASDELGRFGAVRAVRAPRPSRTAAWTALVVVFCVVAGAVLGSPNGDSSYVGILGVLGREELDLRGVGLVFVLAAGALLVTPRATRLPLPVLAAAAAAPFVVTFVMARPGLDVGAAALAVERGAPLGNIPLRVLRRVTDRDHDGASARFGGGDCDDRDAHVFPGADDTPGDGVDQDCSGSDETAPVPAPAITVVKMSSFVRDRFPAGLSVVLVTVDTLRADLGYAGNPRPLSPHLDALARTSTVFEHAVSLASYTGKSVGPMLIGKYPSETVRSFDHFDRFGPEETFVQERLEARGVKTSTAQAHWYFRPDTGLGRGFDLSDYSAEPRVPQAEGDRTVNGDVLTDRALALLEKQDPSRPFYLWLHYVDPHAAYVAHPEFAFGTTSRDLYDGEIAFVDHHVGRLLDRIASGPLAAHTAILVTSDHGEAFGEHGMVRHGREVWEELVHVPLIVHVPGVPPRRVSVRRSAIDVVPTILELMDVERPSGEGRDFVEGRSLVPDVAGEPTVPRPVLVDMSEGPYNDERQAFYDGALKLILTGGRPLGLYDLEADPAEKHDLSADRATLEPVLARYKAFRRTLRSVPARR